MKVALLVGPCPPGACGVGDYTACLGDALRARGADVHVITSGDWSLFDVLNVDKTLREQNFDIVHIQYPTLGFGAKLGPQGLSLLRKSVVTIHEASQRRILRKLALFPFTVRAERLIFTSRFERRFAVRWAPWISRLSSVIPVGSNIRMGKTKESRALGEVLHFGLIMPGKGLEQVIKLSGLIKAAGLPLTVRIVGRTPLKHANYLEKLTSETTDLPVIWDLDLSEGQVADRLAEASIAYLPYPDGASERRTTLQAALLNGVAVITTNGPQTPARMGKVVRFCKNAEESLVAICYLIRHADEMARIANSAAQFGQRYTWDRIAELHLRVYEGMLTQRISKSNSQHDDLPLQIQVDNQSDSPEPYRLSK